MATPTYTTAAIVKARFEDFDTSMSDSKIQDIIIDQESVIDAVMMMKARGTKPAFTFSAAKHGLIRDTATALAAFWVLTAQPTGESGNITSARASLMGDFFWAISRRNLKLLGDTRISSYLKGL